MHVSSVITHVYSLDSPNFNCMHGLGRCMEPIGLPSEFSQCLHLC